MDRFDHPFVRAAFVGALMLALGLTLSACGRKGPLEFATRLHEYIAGPD